MIDKSVVLTIVENKGPVLPRDVVKEVGGDTFLVGAILSQLVDKKEIKISHTKIGGSPVYYTSGQKEKLQDLYKFLKEKEKEAYDLIKSKQVMRDATSPPAIRVALRNIRDFAKPLEVKIKGVKEIFWKWYLLDNNKVESFIREIVKKDFSSSTVKEKEPKPIEEEPPQVEKEKQQILQKEEPKEIEEKKETPKPEIKTDEKQELLEQVKTHFTNKNIEIIEEKVIRKNSEIEMIVNVPSPVGMLKFFCKIRKKKKNTDKDLSSAYVEGQMKKLPVLYVTTGTFTKKAEQLLETEFNMAILKL